MNIYLASPYSSKQDGVMDIRYQANLHAASCLFKIGHLVYSPIISWHVPAKMGYIPKDTKFFRELNYEFLHRFADELWLLDLIGWEESVGVKEEIEYAKKLDLTCRKVSCTRLSQLLLYEMPEAIINWRPPLLGTSKEEFRTGDRKMMWEESRARDRECWEQTGKLRKEVD